MARGHFVARTAAGAALSQGDCELEADEKGIALSPTGDAPLYLPYEQAVCLAAADYRIAISLEDGTAVEVSRLGTMFGDLLRRMRDSRNEVWERGLFLRGVKRVDAFPCEVTLADGPCPAELRLYEDRLSVLPERGDPFGVPYAFVQDTSLDSASYQLRARLSGGDELLVGKLKQRTTELLDLLNDLLAASRKRTAAALAEYLPGLPALKLQALARLMADGLAARRADVEAIEPTAWQRLETVVAGTAELAETYRFLAEMASAPDVAMGIKQLRPAEEETAEEEEGGVEEAPAAPIEVTGEAADEQALAEEQGGPEPARSPLVTWFFCPIPKGAKARGDFIAQEITSEAGHATYFFRVDQGTDWQTALGRLNRAMLTLDFRRRPIYLKADELGRDPHAFAIRHLPHLRTLRESFAGRAIHTSLEGWKASVETILGGGSAT